ncbi:MAG: hypothetical protein AB7Q27_14675 [Acidimicrobiia bacterium]
MHDEHGVVAHALLHVREALALDDRLAELGVRVIHAPTSDIICIRGTVGAAEQQRDILAVVCDELRNHGVTKSVRDETTVMVIGTPGVEASPR